jgi:hypothetical protein
MKESRLLKCASVENQMMDSAQKKKIVSVNFSCAVVSFVYIRRFGDAGLGSERFRLVQSRLVLHIQI